MNISLHKNKTLLFIFSGMVALLLSQPSTISASGRFETQKEGQAAMGEGVNYNVTSFAGGDYINSIFIGGGTHLMGARDGEGNVLTGGVFGTMVDSTTALLTNPPVHTATYIADVMQNIGIAQPAYAQGIGFSALNPVLKIWKAFRNLAYFCFIIVFVVIGFMIMFRKKVGHQSIVTIQESLPKIVTTLLLITFSYAIAGFVIDLIYFSIFLITGLFEQFGIFSPGGAKVARNLVFGKNILALGFSLFPGTGEAAGEGAAAVTSILNEAFGDWATAISMITTPAAYLIIAIAIIIALFRTFISLISAYIAIIMATIFAPIQLIMNVAPESEAFKKWFQGLIANAAIFPAVVTMVILGAALTGGQSRTSEAPDHDIFPLADNVGWVRGDSTSGWVPPLISGGSESETGTNAIRSIIGLGMILLLPEVAKMVKEALQYKDAGYGAAAMGSGASGISFFRGAEQLREQQAQKIFYKKQLEGTNATDLNSLERFIVNPMSLGRDPKKG